MVPVLGDLSLPLWGLTSEHFAELAHSIDAIYHNGAAVNFVYPYRLLRDANVSATREALRLASLGRAKPIHFVSTFSVHAASDRRAGEIITESAPLPSCTSLHDGYSQSKWVAEQMLQAAAARGWPVTIYRPGRITGHSGTGIANTKDFLHTMILGCLELGAAPQLDMCVDMTPVDYVSRAIVELSGQTHPAGQVFHLVNPRSPRLEELVFWMRSAGHSIEEMSFAEWRRRLLALAGQLPGEMFEPLAQVFSPAADAAENGLPARLLDPTLDCSQASSALATVGVELPAVDERLLAVYLQKLQSSGFLETAAVPRSVAEGTTAPPPRPGMTSPASGR